MAQSSDELDFAPTDPTDGRDPWEWKSKYPPEARRAFTLEAWYLALVLFASGVVVYVLWASVPQDLLQLNDKDYRVFARYGEAWAAGTLGGCLFSAKWLYHTVARGRWHLDRRVWRFFTPHLSGALAFGIVVLATSSFLLILDQSRLKSPGTVVALAFLVGYFSDNATAALARLADRAFGEDKPKDPQESAAGQRRRGGDNRRQD